MRALSKLFKYIFFWRFGEQIKFLSVVKFNDKNFALARITKRKRTSLFLYALIRDDFFVRYPKKVHLFQKNGRKEDIKDADNFRFSTLDGNVYLSYTNKIRGKKVSVAAVSKDLFRFDVLNNSTANTKDSVLVSDFSHNGLFIKYTGGSSIGAVSTKKFTNWQEMNPSIINARDGSKFDGSRFFDNSDVKLSPLFSVTKERGVYLFYDASTEDEDNFYVRVGYALLANDNPEHVLQRGEMPLWEQEISKSDAKSVRPIGVSIDGGEINIYCTFNENIISLTTLPDPYEYMDKPEESILKLKKSAQNPIVVPNQYNHWETVATFNPTAAYIDGKVHLLYRAMGYDGLSFMGYAGSENGIDFFKRFGIPAYHPREPFEGVTTSPSSYSELYMSGGGWGGCEDARMTVLEDKVYVAYVAYNGYNAPRIAMSSIDLADFINQDWVKWSKPQLLSKAEFVTKGPCLFPEKIEGKYVICHRVFPDILIDYVDDLDFESEEKWLEGHERIKINNPRWDSRKIGVGGAPIKTDKGWLLIYYGVDDRDPARYMVGAMLLDLKNPHKIVARSKKPILMPEEWYENDGHKSGVAYPCGYIIKNGMLYVYYGGADTVTCVATAPAKEFIDELAKQTVEPFTLRESIII